MSGTGKQGDFGFQAPQSPTGRSRPAVIAIGAVLLGILLTGSYLAYEAFATTQSSVPPPGITVTSTTWTTLSGNCELGESFGSGFHTNTSARFVLHVVITFTASGSGVDPGCEILGVPYVNPSSFSILSQNTPLTIPSGGNGTIVLTNQTPSTQWDGSLFFEISDALN